MLKLTEDQELLIENLQELLSRELPESYLHEVDSKGEYPYKLANVLHENGYSTIGMPEEYGGTPADTTTLCLIQETLGKAAMPVNTVNCALRVCDILMFGNDKQKKQIIDTLEETNGVPPFVLGITEPQAGSDDSAIATKYERRDGKVVINGHKCFISLAGQAKYIMCFARDPLAEDPKKVFTAWMVPSNAPGVTLHHLDKIGARTAPFYEVYFENVTVDEEDMVGAEHEGFLFMMKNFEPERLLAAAGALGWAECAYEDAARYANSRVQFGKPIGSFQLIQERITDMAVKIENMRNMIYESAKDIDSGISGRISTAMCKYYVAITAGEVIDSAMQIFGGIGFTADHRVSRLWRDVRSIRFGGGTDEIMIHILGRAILKQYR